MAAAAWLRRFVVSIGIGGASYAIMLGIMVLSTPRRPTLAVAPRL